MKLFLIYENDLQRLEYLLPRLVGALGEQANRPEVQVLCQEAKDIVSNVRWDYGPPSSVKEQPWPPR